MNGLSSEQAALRSKIKNGAMIGGAIVALIVAGLTWLFSGGLEGVVRPALALGLGAVAGFFVYRAVFRSGAGKAKCGKCGAVFSISMVDKVEELISSDAKETIEDAPQDDSAASGKAGKAKAAAAPQIVTRWTEERYQVTETHECAGCQNRTQKTYERVVEKDKTSEPVAAPRPVKGAKGTRSRRSGKK